MTLVSTEIRERVAVVTMNDGRRRNPLSDGMRAALIDALSEMDERDDVRAVVLTGADGNFSSGGDIGAMPPPSLRHAGERLEQIAQLVRLIGDCRHPTVAAVDGVVAGVGLGLAAACDVVLVTERARVLFPFARLGLLPDGGSLATVAQRVGTACARRLFLQAEPVRAAEAVRLGLADELVAEEALMARAETCASELGARAEGTVRAVKRFYAAGDLTVEAALRAEAEIQPEMYFSGDFAEGKQAFFERREPHFGHRAD